MIFSRLALLSLANAPGLAAAATCEPRWSSGRGYSTGSLVSAVVSTSNSGTTTKNFKCISGTEPHLSHCPNYNPANAAQAAAAWADLGKCTGTGADSPVSSPATNPPTHSRWASHGCPDEWENGGSYKAGDVVSLYVFTWDGWFFCLHWKLRKESCSHGVCCFCRQGQTLYG